jgi:hypothetical protein
MITPWSNSLKFFLGFPKGFSNIEQWHTIAWHVWVISF